MRRLKITAGIAEGSQAECISGGRVATKLPVSVGRVETKRAERSNFLTARPRLNVAGLKAAACSKKNPLEKGERETPYSLKGRLGPSWYRHIRKLNHPRGEGNCA